MERRVQEKSNRFIAPLFAAMVGSSPATYVSFEMYTKVSERGLVNQTVLIAAGRWQERQEMINDELEKSVRQLDKEITHIKIELAKAAK